MSPSLLCPVYSSTLQSKCPVSDSRYAMNSSPRHFACKQTMKQTEKVPGGINGGILHKGQGGAGFRCAR